MLRTFVCVVLLAMFAACATATVQTLQVQNGLNVGGSTYSSTESMWMRSSDGLGINNTMLRVGYQTTTSFRSLLRFNYLDEKYHNVDLGFNANQIVGARLVLTTDTAFEGAGYCELRALGQSDEGWTEMYTNWNYKRTDYTPQVAWEGGAGVGSNYSDVIDTVRWMNPGGNAVPTLTALTFDITGAALDVVKNWVSGDDTSGGFIFRADVESGSANNYIDFYSEAYAGVPSYRPMLEIQYIPEPATLAILGVGGLLAALRRKQN